MLRAGELSWRAGLREWCRTRNARPLAEAMAALSAEEREQVFAEIGSDRLRSEIEQILGAFSWLCGAGALVSQDSLAEGM